MLRMYCKSYISFNFSFFYNLHHLPHQKVTHLPKKIQSFFIIYTTYHKNKLHAFTAKKLPDWTIFLYTPYIFHPLAPTTQAPSEGAPAPLLPSLSLAAGPPPP